MNTNYKSAEPLLVTVNNWERGFRDYNHDQQRHKNITPAILREIATAMEEDKIVKLLIPDIYDTDGESSYFPVSYYRLETPEETEKRLKQIEINKEFGRKRRYENYLSLKEEFERPNEKPS